MSQANAPPPQPSNGLGIAGFVVSLAGLVLTCGLLSPIGLLLSLLALLKPPRGFALAGTIVGVIGSVWVVVAGFGMFRAAIGMQEAVEQHAPMIRTTVSSGQGLVAIDQETQATGALPDEERGNELVGAFTDGWGTPLRYELKGATYQIRSAGPDTEFATGDDEVMQPPPTGGR